MKVKKKTKVKSVHLIVLLVFLILAVVWAFVRFIIVGEDSWIKDERGVYVKHGNPSETPGYVAWQQAAVSCAYDLFWNATGEKNSQCLGYCGNYAVDVVHVPRTAEDDLAGNQCANYGDGFVNHFIELDKNKEIVRII